MKHTLIIAEAGVNHNGSIELAKKLIEAAADAGADIVKFQTFKSEKLVAKSAMQADYQKKNLNSGESATQFEMLKKLELSEDAHYVLIEHCIKNNIKFLSTGFDLESVDFLHSIGIDIFKIPSGEITNLPYLRKIGAKNLNVILSTGMSDLKEVENALDILIESGTPKEKIIVLQCNTDYPTAFGDVNLKGMLTMRDAFNISVGYSDHTPGIEIPVAAVALGAEVIEKHFTLDRNMEGPDHKASLEPGELKKMVKSIRHVELALGDGIKRPSESESKNILIVRKSIHLANDIKKGHVISADDLIMKRPATGISPMKYDEVVGKIATKDMLADYLLTFDDIL